MRFLRILLATALMATAMLALPATTGASTDAAYTCTTRTHTYTWSISIFQLNADGSFRHSAGTSGQFSMTDTGCYDGSTAWGTSASWAGGGALTKDGGPSYYTDSAATADFWVNAHIVQQGDNWEWCRLNVFPRQKLTKSGVWSTGGTTYTHSENINPLFTVCSYTFSA